MNKNPKLYTEYVGFKTTPELKELFLTAQNLDKAEFTRLLIGFCNSAIKYISHKHDGVKPHELNDGVKPHELNDGVKPLIPKPVEDWTQEDINDLLGFEDKFQDAVNKNFKSVKLKKKKELSDFEIEQLLIENETQAKYNGVNSLFEGSCE